MVTPVSDIPVWNIGWEADYPVRFFIVFFPPSM
jgi:hypothetical protein